MTFPNRNVPEAFAQAPFSCKCQEDAQFQKLMSTMACLVFACGRCSFQKQLGRSSLLLRTWKNRPLVKGCPRLRENCFPSLCLALRSFVSAIQFVSQVQILNDRPHPLRNHQDLKCQSIDVGQEGTPHRNHLHHLCHCRQRSNCQ